MATGAKQPNRTTWVWGDAKKGIAVVRSARKSGGRYWWDVHHVRDSKTTHVARDFSSKVEAVREAKRHAQFAQKHPRTTTFFGR